MLTIILLLSALGSSSSAPLEAPSTDARHTPMSLSGRGLPVYLNITGDREKQDIIWSCLATIFACTWVAVHPNLSGPWDSEWAKAKRKIVTLIYALLGPEFMAIWAMRQWIAAGEIARKFNEIHGTNNTVHDSCETSPPYGFIPKALNVRWAAFRYAIKEYFKGPYHDVPLSWTRTHGFFVQMGGFVLYRGKTPIRVLGLEGLLKMIEENKVDIPDYTEDDIADKSKGDFLTKLVVVTQTTWFVVQCIARWAFRLPVTELEVVTLAFAALNVITYMLWWEKPQNAAIALRIQLRGDLEDGPADVTVGSRGTKGTLLTEEEVPRGGEKKESRIIRDIRQAMREGWDGWLAGVPFGFVIGLVFPFVKLSGLEESERGPLRVPMFSADRTRDRRDVLPLTGIGVLFGAIHLIPWWSSFPSVAEAVLWRASAFIIILEPLILLPTFLTVDTDKHWLVRFLGFLTAAISILGAPFYILARLALLILPFTTLRQLPPGAYIDIKWMSFVPHI